MSAPAIPHASTAVTAFVGVAENGPLNRAVHIQERDYERLFGPPTTDLGFAANLFFTNGGAGAWIVRLAEMNSTAIETARRALDSIPDLNLVALPGISDRGILDAAATYCNARRAFLIADCDRSAKTPDQMIAWTRDLNLQHPESAAVYAPWLCPAGGKNVSGTLPPSGIMAGIYARSDASRGVWIAPAGTEVPVKSVSLPLPPLSHGQFDILNAAGINAIRNAPGFGLIPWGARTLAGDTSEYKYVPIRRLALFIERSIDAGTKWAQFEPNHEPTWSLLRLSVGNFLEDLYRQGALMGSVPASSYFVRCDATTTTQADIEAGRLNIVVGYAPLRPAEFTIIRIQQIAAQPA